jgi:hypothetical protein
MDLSKSFVALPKYFKSHKPEDLYDIKKSPFSFSVGKEDMSYNEVLNLDIERHLEQGSPAGQEEYARPRHVSICAAQGAG